MQSAELKSAKQPLLMGEVAPKVTERGFAEIEVAPKVTERVFRIYLLPPLNIEFSITYISKRHLDNSYVL